LFKFRYEPLWEVEMPRLEIVDWITPNALVLSLNGHLDATAGRQVDARLRELLRTSPDILVALDLTGVATVDVDAAEELLLGVVALRARGASFLITRPSAACVTVLRRLNLDFLPHLPKERVQAGVTA
jgi:rsbT co-antagonist protein RsbR